MKVSDAKTINDTLIQMVKDKEIGLEDLDAAKVLLTAMVIGANKRKVKAFANCNKFEFYWRNLETPGIFKDGKVDVDIEENDIDFLLKVNVAKGFLETRFVADKKRGLE